MDRSCPGKGVGGCSRQWYRQEGTGDIQRMKVRVTGSDSRRESGRGWAGDICREGLVHEGPHRPCTAVWTRFSSWSPLGRGSDVVTIVNICWMLATCQPLCWALLSMVILLVLKILYGWNSDPGLEQWLFLIYRQQNYGPNKACDLTKFTWLLRGRDRVWLQVCVPWKPVS